MPAGAEPPEELPLPPALETVALTGPGVDEPFGALASKPNSPLRRAGLLRGLRAPACAALRFGGVGVGVARLTATVATGVGVGVARLVALRFGFAAFGGSGVGLLVDGRDQRHGAGIAPVITHVAAPTPLRHRPSAAAAGPNRPPPVEIA